MPGSVTKIPVDILLIKLYIRDEREDESKSGQRVDLAYHLCVVMDKQCPTEPTLNTDIFNVKL